MKLVKVLAVSSLLLSSGSALADNVSISSSGGYTSVQGNLELSDSNAAGWFNVTGYGNNILVQAYSTATRTFKSCRVDETDSLWKSAQQALTASTADNIYFYFRFKDGESKCNSLFGISKTN